MIEALCFLAAAAVGGIVWFILTLFMRDERAMSMVIPAHVEPLRRRGGAQPVSPARVKWAERIQPQGRRIAAERWAQAMTAARALIAKRPQRQSYTESQPSIVSSQPETTPSEIVVERAGYSAVRPTEIAEDEAVATVLPAEVVRDTTARAEVEEATEGKAHDDVFDAPAAASPTLDEHAESATRAISPLQRSISRVTAAVTSWLSSRNKNGKTAKPAVSTVEPIVSAEPEVPAWIRGFVDTTPSINERVRLLWLQVWTRQGDNLEAFLSLVESSDPELKPVAALARRQRRPLTLRSLQEAEEWIQQSA